MVVGIGASESSFRSLERLFAHLPSQSGAAFVVAVQQKAGLDQRAVLEALGRQSNFPAVLAAEGEALEADHIYLAPHDFVVTVIDDRLHVRRSEEPPGLRGTVDTLLVSIAEQCGARAIAVALAGLGADGILGVREVKMAGGFALVEASDGDEQTPAHTSAEGIADVVASVEVLAERIAGHIRHLVAHPDNETPAPKEATEQLTRIAAILRNRTGHDFHGYKQNTFLRRIQRRMKVTQIDGLEAYADHLRGNSEEAQHLFQDLLISVTDFFRDPKEFELIERTAIPKLFEGKGAADQVRIWVLGCATGEEAYSMAILLREHADKLDVVPHLQIFATDIDARALALARSGRYPAGIAKFVTPERLARWFTKEGDTYCVAKELREICIFSGHNLIKDAPFSRIDLISCRNLLIYLDSELQNRLIPLFHFSLRPGGYLFLGPSENVTRHPKLFAPLDRYHRVFRRLDAAVRGLPEFPLSIGRGVATAGEGRSRARTRGGDESLARRAERIAERYAPAYVVVDEHYDILHFSGRTGRYLEPTTGAATLNLLSLVHRDLRPELRAALHKALDQREPLRLDRLMMEVEGVRHAVAVAIEPISADPDNPQSLMVVFQDARLLPEDGPAGVDDPGHLRDEHLQRLEAELRLSRERLQASVEELESTNEELKSSNEEYQSINEELQSANEELETSKEELQSVNEELQTVNGELAHRVSELATANSDLKNLLESTQIATVFLDNQLKIKNYTPAIADVFHLVETDLGRSLTHIKARIAYPEMADDVRQVARTLATVEREVSDPQKGSRYIVRVLPYRSTDNFIAGVVLTFLDVTATARAETALRDSEERFRRMAQAAPVFLMTAGPDLGWDYVNPKFSEYTGLVDGAALGNGWLAAVHPDDVESNQKRWREAARIGKSFEDEYRLRTRDGTYRWFLCRAEPVVGPDGKATRWFGSCADVNELRSSQGRQRLLLAELQHRVKNILALVRAVATRTARNSDSVEAFMTHFEGRLSALARSQAILAHRNGAGMELEDLVREELLVHGRHDGEGLSVTGPAIRLNARATETLGLAIHELSTNAVKYGALSTPKGALAVSWRIYDSPSGRRLSFEWLESGVPVIDPAPSRMGFGRELIEHALPYELGASSALEFARGGLRCVLELPLTDKLVVEGESEEQDEDDLLPDQVGGAAE